MDILDTNRYGLRRVQPGRFLLSSFPWLGLVSPLFVWACSSQVLGDVAAEAKWHPGGERPPEHQRESAPPLCASVVVAPSSEPLPPKPPNLALLDRGAFEDLSAKVVLHAPSWLEPGPVSIYATRSETSAYRYVGGVAIAPATAPAKGALVVDSFGPQDQDGDGIPDQLDVLLGAKRTVLLKTPYVETYRRLAYPGGDVPRSEGVCSDVVVRALRNAGFDLQQLVYDDSRQASLDYPAIRKRDSNIDHRRVRNLKVYFSRHLTRLPVDASPRAQAYLPGDIVLFNTLGDSQPDHIGIVSDALGPSGLPLVINSWTVGYVTSEMDLLGSIEVTHHFRIPAPALAVGDEHRGVQGLLSRAGVVIPKEHEQLLVTLAPQWTSTFGVLYRFERDFGPKSSHRWNSVGTPVTVRFGARGLARGRGELPPNHSWLRGLEPKLEGDHRSPAGLFLLGTAFGRQRPTRVPKAGWPFRMAEALDVWVDDPESEFYNTLQQEPAETGAPPWKSAERLRQYQLALPIRHNDAPIIKGSGSAHFLHDGTGTRPTVGCTSLPRRDLALVLDWLDEKKRPVLLQAAGEILP